MKSIAFVVVVLFMTVVSSAMDANAQTYYDPGYERGHDYRTQENRIATVSDAERLLGWRFFGIDRVNRILTIPSGARPSYNTGYTINAVEECASEPNCVMFWKADYFVVRRDLKPTSVKGMKESANLRRSFCGGPKSRRVEELMEIRTNLSRSRQGGGWLMVQFGRFSRNPPSMELPRNSLYRNQQYAPVDVVVYAILLDPGIMKGFSPIVTGSGIGRNATKVSGKDGCIDILDENFVSKEDGYATIIIPDVGRRH